MHVGKAVYLKKCLLKILILICQELLLGFGLISLWERNLRSIVGIVYTKIHVFYNHYLYYPHNDGEVVKDTFAFLPDIMVIIVVHL